VCTHTHSPPRRVASSTPVASRRIACEHTKGTPSFEPSRETFVSTKTNPTLSRIITRQRVPPAHISSLSLAGCFEFSLQKSEEKCCLRKRNDVDRSIDGWMDGWMARSCISMQHLVRQGGYPPGPTRATRSFDVVHNTFTFSTALHAVQRRPQWE
jgi:hypothetical protein